jgi:hypothetical protein
MDSSAVIAEAFSLVRQDLYLHLEEVEDFADEEDWTEEQLEWAHELLGELCAVLREVLFVHRPEDGVCQACGHQWPCSVVVLIHAEVKSPQRHFVRLLQQRRTERAAML